MQCQLGERRAVVAAVLVAASIGFVMFALDWIPVPALVSAAPHTRRTYRNLFPTHAGWAFAGVRLAPRRRASE